MGLIKSAQHFLYRYRYRYGSSLKLKVPVDVSLELASLCNQHCGYCYHADPKNLPFDRNLMDFGMALRIITQCADLGVHSLKFNYRGESTLHPNFEQITEYAKSLARGSTFIDRLTNSNFKFKTDREDIFRGLCNQTKVKVSFDSFRKEIFEQQRAGGIYELALANVDRFYHHPGRRVSGTELVIQAVRTKLNVDEDLEGFVRNRWPSATTSIRDVVAGRVDRDISSYSTRDRKTERQSCLQAHVRVIFTHEGKALPCCPSLRENLVIGHIKDQTVEQIFNSEIAKTLRKDLKSGAAFAFDPCKTCSSFESYSGFKPSWGS